MMMIKKNNKQKQNACFTALIHVYHVCQEAANIACFSITSSDGLQMADKLRRKSKEMSGETMYTEYERSLNDLIKLF